MKFEYFNLLFHCNISTQINPISMINQDRAWPPRFWFVLASSWGLVICESRNTHGQRAQLVITFHRRRYGKLEALLDLPFPQKPIKEPDPPINVIREALRVKDFMAAHPDETYLSAAAKLNLHRKRISKFLTIANFLPPNYIKTIHNCTDSRILCQLSVNRLLHIASLDSSTQQSQELNTIIAKKSP